ncbi:hypothetical protein H1164_13800 [Thermoactinomyces daqus]|uniref:Uncharacterized protein n=1 Tax=Thermoactinomyces daqus TaxID=1329516 RepID=A0A7W2AJK5_9BACL|nr:hypothetical protein [Thermoactinomyces daqus]MBA4543958.1 hypothetical protein [Thermoactinomyces daqus]
MPRDELERYGMQVPYKDEDKTKSAFVSLKLALKAYFSTDIVHHHDLDGINVDTEHDEYLTTLLRYQEIYLQTIFHFHHFFELLIKDTLRKVHPLLPVKLSKLDDKNSKKIIEVMNNTRAIFRDETVEFSTALSRLVSLTRTDYNQPLCELFKNDYNHRTLTFLNQCRNRAWHKGTWVLRYTELDKFIGQRVLPLVLEAINNSLYKGFERSWMYEKPIASIDPIQNIIDLTKKDQIDYNQIALNKAIGRACYNIPKKGRMLFKSYKRSKGVLKAKALIEESGDIYDIRECFVCGYESLILFKEEDWDYDDNGEMIDGWWKILMAECETCKLKIFDRFGEPSVYDSNIPKLWLGGDLK